MSNGHSDFIDLLNDWDRKRAEDKAKDLQKFHRVEPPYELNLEKDFYAGEPTTNGEGLERDEKAVKAEIQRTRDSVV